MASVGPVEPSQQGKQLNRPRIETSKGKKGIYSLLCQPTNATGLASRGSGHGVTSHHHPSALLRDTSFILSALILTHAQSFHSSRQVGSILANPLLRYTRPASFRLTIDSVARVCVEKKPDSGLER
ncbi:hypothetical protein PGT21_018644 [Puccinia graminis f. sp. tritici]|uniref:Uncharacterized protein n=1 Tax=Puccinia graminis f. sp. tritici TaxID=56615 RepID=A0A5B0QAY2_PUCGR|nr:hypothetical protein PGT21_018644 [Puccinia graminis f. sp. tritici]